ncbi:iron complex outermembrane receptor protein [Nitrospirillum pindoramense]|uniref:Iron complex outermembrane receptor protein n=2 Tax=Nitrospirillum amazonense TaxID=28077 RepID=A0A560GYK7_9PROT|nr:iron complex outermembrane receptor protein [Nitrospirillum amazonense]
MKSRSVSTCKLTTHLRATVSVAAMVYLCAGISTATAQQKDADQADDGIAEIVITGTYLKVKSQADIPDPTQTLDRDAINRSGVSNLSQLTNLTPANIGSMGGAQDLSKGGPENHGSRSANLRGLGPSSTLVLLNGHRTAATDTDGNLNPYVNLNTLVPLIEIQRVETVLDGASALYGSDAIAGVMNFITDDKFNGVAAGGQYTFIDGAPKYLAEGMYGGGNDRFHVVGSFSYEHQKNLQNSQRRVTNFYSPSGTSQPGNFILSSAPHTANGGDVIIDNGVNGAINYTQLYNSTVAARLAGGASPSAAATKNVQVADPSCDVPGTGGVFVGSRFPLGACQFSYQAMNPIQPAYKQVLSHVRGTYDLTDTQQLFFEGRYYVQDSDRYGVASTPITRGNIIVPANNPGNPFGVPVTFLGRVMGVNGPYDDDKTNLTGTHLVMGAKGKLWGDWEYSLDGVYSREQQVYDVKETDLVSLQYAVNGYGGAGCPVSFNGTASFAPGTNGCSYFSPFGKDQKVNSQAVIDQFFTYTTSRTVSEYMIAEGVVTGKLFELPGGTSALAVGGQFRNEYRSILYDAFRISGRTAYLPPGVSGSGTRQIGSGFAELGLPILKDLYVDTAIRYEDYGPFDSVDPKIGVNWHATPELTLRAAASTAFRAPALAQSVGSAATSGTSNLYDPLVAGDKGTFRNVNTVPNNKLQPETSTNYDLGITWNPIRHAEVSVDYWNYDFKKKIALQNAQAVINADPTGPAVIRDASGTLVGVNVGYFNAGAVTTDGIDVSAAYTWDLDDHQLTLRSTLAYIHSYEIQNSPGGPVYEVVGHRNANSFAPVTPRWRDNTYLTWEHGPHTATVTMRYTSGVVDDYGVNLGAASSATVGSWVVWDAQYAFQATDAVRVSVGAVNLLDRDPPWAKFTGYLPSLEDALGRQVYIRLDTKF